MGVANLRRRGGEGLLEAGSDVFPNDPRPVAFLRDHRFRDGAIEATVTRTGAGAGVVLRRAGPRAYYAAIFDTEQSALLIIRRTGVELAELARAVVTGVAPPLTLRLAATGSGPTALRASLAAGAGPTHEVSASDAEPELQRPGDPGVLATARTLFPSGNPVYPPLGNLHLLPYGVQEGQAVIESPAGEALVAEIRRQSTAGFTRIAIDSAEAPRTTAPSVIAATTGAPRRGGAHLLVATDVPARVTLEISRSPDLVRPRVVKAGRTGEFESVERTLADLPQGRRIYWRARCRRGETEAVGPVRSFRVPRARGSGRPVRVAVGSCGVQFGAIFDRLAEARPDVFVWQGDLNYPDTHGPLAQTVSGYAGIWRDFLANPRLAPVLERAAFAAQRDDHDYGLQDANSTNLLPWGLGPWESLVGRRTYFRFPAGLAEFWVLNQRHFKSDPVLPDDVSKSLLGLRQRRWLLRTLAASRSPFKVICSPCTVLMEGNERDGGWANSFSAERELILAHISERVTGQTVFLTGDTHLTGVYDREDRFEARAAPIDIPTPNDVTLINPNAAAELRAAPGIVYADDQGHFSIVRARARRGLATLEVELVKQDGTIPFERRFEQPLR
jgi:hypothetical protein